MHVCRAVGNALWTCVCGTGRIRTRRMRKKRHIKPRDNMHSTNALDTFFQWKIIFSMQKCLELVIFCLILFAGELCVLTNHTTLGLAISRTVQLYVWIIETATYTVGVFPCIANMESLYQPPHSSTHIFCLPMFIWLDSCIRFEDTSPYSRHLLDSHCIRISNTYTSPLRCMCMCRR